MSVPTPDDVSRLKKLSAQLCSDASAYATASPSVIGTIVRADLDVVLPGPTDLTSNFILYTMKKYRWSFVVGLTYGASFRGEII